MAAAVVVLAAASIGLASRLEVAGSALVFAIPAVPYTLFTILAVVRMSRNGSLSEKMRPRSGDITFGAVVTAMLVFGAIAGRSLLAPHGSLRGGWLMRIYQQIGDPEMLQRRVIAVSLAVVVVAALEEISWRGYVYPILEERFGTRRAWPATALLYALAHVPTMFLLKDPFAGPNPLVVIAALGCGLVWGLVVARTGRLPVAILSHALFTVVVAIHYPLYHLG
jgi:membrane protease YdiL (CAAX protease family)